MKLILAGFVVLFASNTILAQTEKDKRFVKEIYVGSSFASLIRSPREIFPVRNKFVTTNPYANLEAIFNFHPKFSLRIPIGYGLGNLNGHVDQGGSFKHHWFDLGPDPTAPVNDYQHGPRLDAPSISQQITSKFKYTNPSFIFARPQDLIYQIGLFPQVFIYEENKTKWSITAGVNYGKMDKYAISEYNSFSSIKNSTNDTIIGWIQTDSRLEFESNSFNFFRVELLLGIDIKLSKRFTLNLETGFTHFIYRKGGKPDKIFTNLDNNGDNLIFTDTKNNDYTDKFENASTSGSVIPIYSINRFSLRYQFR